MDFIPQHLRKLSVLAIFDKPNLKNRTMKNKKGEIGIKEIVGIILAIATLVFGLVFIRGQSLKSEKLVAGEIDTRTLESAKSLLEVDLIDKNLALSKTSFSLSRGTEELFLIGIKNNNADGAELKLAVISNNAKIDAEEWFVYKTTLIRLDANKKYFYTTKLTIPDTAESGDYIFDVNLIDSSSDTVLETDNFLVGVE